MSSPWLSLAISDAILAFSSLFGVFLMAQCYRMAESRLPVIGAMLGYILVGSAAALGTIRFGITQSWAPAHDMMTAAAVTLGPSLLAAALGSICLGWNWQKPTWWRMLIGLMAGYELFRQFGLQHTFNMTINTVAMAVMAFSAFRTYHIQRIFSGFILIAVGAYSLASLVIGTEGQLAGYLRLDLYRYLLALGHLFSASAIFILTKREFRS